MSSSNRKTRIVGFAIVLLSIAVAAAGFFVVRRDVEAMRQAGQENILWSAVQLEIELMRFQNVLAEFKADEPDISPGRVNTRFDILWSRVSLFRQGPVGDRLSAYDQETAAIALLFAKMQEAEPLVTGLVAGDRATASRLQDMFYPFSVALRRLSQTVLHGEEHKNADLREDLSRSSSILSVLSGIALMASLLLIFVFSRDSDRFRKLADENQGLLEASRHANRAKSQFLAMMSHELRTLMNGVLGLLALVRQQGLSQHQTRLMEQADRSGRQMIGLLRDILDFSALQDDQLKLEQKPFEPRRLIKAVRDMFEPVALREGIAFEAHADDSCPERVIGDFARLRQALTHLATYILETAGAGNIALDLSYEAGCLRASISFDYNRAGGEWEPDLIMGKADRQSDSFASEALGPAVSRGLIERMGGMTKLDNPGDNRIAVLVSVPAEKLIVDVLRIRVVCQSAALDAICRAALRAENVRFLDAGSTEFPHVVMIEAGGDREPANLKSSRETYPQAMLVALGKPQDAEEFDDIVQVPIDIAAVRQAGFMRMAFAASEKPDLRFAEE